MYSDSKEARKLSNNSANCRYLKYYKEIEIKENAPTCGKKSMEIRLSGGPSVQTNQVPEVILQGTFNKDKREKTLQYTVEPVAEVQPKLDLPIIDFNYEYCYLFKEAPWNISYDRLKGEMLLNQDFLATLRIQERTLYKDYRVMIYKERIPKEEPLRKLRPWAVLEWKPRKQQCSLHIQKDKRVLAQYAEQPNGNIQISFPKMPKNKPQPSSDQADRKHSRSSKSSRQNINSAKNGSTDRTFTESEETVLAMLSCVLLRQFKNRNHGQRTLVCMFSCCLCFLAFGNSA